MIDIIVGHHNAAHRDALTAMYQLRHRVFSERLGWQVNSQHGLEMDDYDRDDTTYLLAYDDNEKLCGTWRLLPTQHPYMLKNTFPQLLQGHAPPAHATIWETSRFAVEQGPSSLQDDTQASPQVNRITQELFIGLVAHCVAQKIEKVYTVYDIRIARLLPRVGCTPFWRSKPMKIGVTTALAGGFTTNQQVLDTICRKTGMNKNVLRHTPWHRHNVAA